MRRMVLISTLVAAGGVGAAVLVRAQQPTVQNAVQATRAVTTLSRDVAGAGGGGEASWLGWQVPMVAGDRELCSNWVNDERVVRGTMLEGGDGRREPVFAAPAGPLALEAGTNLVILVRVVEGKIERLRALGGDCPIDAGGKHLTWLSGVTPAASLEYLRSLTNSTLMEPTVYRRLSDTVVSAIALHQNAAAGPLLVELASQVDDTHVRELALQWLARARGAFGFDYLTRTLAATRDVALRRQLVSAIGRTHEPGTAAALLSLAKTDTDEKARAEALGAYATIAPDSTEVTSIISKDRNTEVRSRGVSGLLRRANRDGIPSLIALARSTDDLALRKEIVRGLGRSDDARAVKYLEELVTR
jgi:hypothetical protein